MPEPEIGARSGPLELTVDQQVVAQYAHAADDYNPIHFDDTAARRLRHGRLSLKFVRPVAVGETVTAYAVVRSHAPITLELTAQTAPGTPVTVGTAMLGAAPDGGSSQSG